MNPEDYRKLKKVEAILVSNYVDTSKLDIDVVGESAYIAGELHIYEYGPEGQKLKDPTELRQAVKKTCLIIEQEIRRTGELYHIEWKLKNWEKYGQQWVQKKGA
jgi:hypothetical protein